MKLCSAKCHERATLRKLWRHTGNSSLLPGQQFTVDRCCTWWLESFAFAFVLFCYITNHLMIGPLGNSEFCFPRISMFPSTSFRETFRFSGNKIHCSSREILRFSGNKIHCSPRDQSLVLNIYLCYVTCHTQWARVTYGLIPTAKRGKEIKQQWN